MDRFSEQIHSSFIIAILPKLNYIFEVCNVFLIPIECNYVPINATCFLSKIRQSLRLLTWHIVSIIRKYLVTANIHLSNITDFSQ